MLEIYEYFYWIGMGLLFISCCFIGVIGLKNIHSLFPFVSIFNKLRPFDVKLAKYSGILFALGILFFIVGVILE